MYGIVSQLIELISPPLLLLNAQFNRFILMNRLKCHPEYDMKLSNAAELVLVNVREREEILLPNFCLHYTTEGDWKWKQK